ncbi:hypothetical protein Trihar35433_10121 [Trichoderma harzianum]|nr:hypothetical protein Trihar35433_10121 [Trichoderma harzianum]
MESTERGHAGLIEPCSQSGPGPKTAGLFSAIIVYQALKVRGDKERGTRYGPDQRKTGHGARYRMRTVSATAAAPRRNDADLASLSSYLILLSRQGKVRLAKWFTTLSPKDKAKIVKDVSQLVLARRTRMCNFLEYKDTKIVYRRYASLFFIAGCSSEDNELITLEIIHRYVEQMDKYYGNVCELDIIFSFTKAYYILDELLLAGELQESSKKNVLRCIGQQDSLEDMEQAEQITEKLRELPINSTTWEFENAAGKRNQLRATWNIRGWLQRSIPPINPPKIQSSLAATPPIPDSYSLSFTLLALGDQTIITKIYDSGLSPCLLHGRIRLETLDSIVSQRSSPLPQLDRRADPRLRPQSRDRTTDERHHDESDFTFECSLEPEQHPAVNMKYLPVQEFEAVTGALNFNTPDCNVTGGCDLYTTKSTGSDKKLYKNIDKDLSSQHAALLKLGASLSPPDREHMLATSRSMQLFSHSSAFGPLSELSSRRTFAYLIATLNASHPHYDFSHVLRPGDFKRERNLKRVMANLDSILQNTRPGFDLGSSYDSSAGSDVNAQWGPQCWSLINKEMRLNECTIFSYHPEVDPFEEDESAIWAVHYFFFNRALKRVAYLYVRVVPVISSQSPTLRPVKGGVHKRHTAVESDGAKKRTKYWLGDQDAELVPPYEDDEEPLDDGLYWNRGEDGDIVQFSDDDFAEDEPVDEDEDEDDDYDMTSPRRERLMSEDVAGQMEI